MKSQCNSWPTSSARAYICTLIASLSSTLPRFPKPSPLTTSDFLKKKINKIHVATFTDTIINKRYQTYGFNFFNFFCRKRTYQEYSHSFHAVIRIWSEVIHETIKMPNKYSKLLLSSPHQRQEQSAKIARYKGQKPFFCIKRLFNIKLNNNTRVTIHFILEVSLNYQ